MPRSAKFAKILSILHDNGFLKDVECKGPVLDFIRKASEPTGNWHATSHFRSNAAALILAGRTYRSAAEYHRFCNPRLSHEHMVPNAVLYRLILEEPDVTEVFILKLLRRFGLRTTITREENALLTKRFQSKMPEQFYVNSPGNDLYMNPLARYIVTGIDGDLVQRRCASWHSSDANQSPQLNSMHTDTK